MAKIGIDRAKRARDLLTYTGFLGYSAWYFYFVNRYQEVGKRELLVDTLAIPLATGVFIFVAIFIFKILLERRCKYELPPLDNICSDDKNNSYLKLWLAAGFLLAPTIGAMHALIWINLIFILLLGV